MDKIKTLAEIIRISRELKRQGKTVGFMTGCFDIVHMGHINTFRFAKSKSDVVMVGLENDATIRISKGKDRPINSWVHRSQFLSELESVDYIFKITKVTKFGDPGAYAYYQNLTHKIKPDFIITNNHTDKFIKEKKQGAESVGAKLLVDTRLDPSSTSHIITKLKASELI